MFHLLALLADVTTGDT